jgi:hypothetical protein
MAVCHGGLWWTSQLTFQAALSSPFELCGVVWCGVFTVEPAHLTFTAAVNRPAWPCCSGRQVSVG